ncbi:sulfite exporter TauE/SafE family protein [Geitlerinema sp. PCC 9228]|jgi:hypothetical protein|uniref:sulfite exporter TauE/SafE family protein n=1 Tax=Geitlerinema sp. PCC 9228 TaxID=111611 RepID=UPI0008F9A2F9|nr:sulfite exporter TauE/SafE family protein [Geitlerinema sp. PCC 9228]
MISTEIIAFGFSGMVAGILAGLLGIGGGVLLVPLLVTFGVSAVQAVATSTLSIVITALAGSWQNWRMGYINPEKVLGLGIPAIATTQLGAIAADRIAEPILLFAFGCLLLANVYLIEFRRRVVGQRQQQPNPLDHNANDEPAAPRSVPPFVSRTATGGLAGFLAGLFGVGGGVIIVPMQILLLQESIQSAVQTSLGAIVIIALSACAGHLWEGNVLWLEGVTLGVGGMLGVQASTRFLPSLPESFVSFTFRALLVALAIYIFWQAGQRYFM